MHTMQSLADGLGVSRQVVSAVLNGRAVRVGTATRQRILAAAAGFSPNRAARNLRRRRHGTVGLVVPSLWDLHPAFADSFVASARERDWRVLVEVQAALPVLLHERSVDALAIMADPASGRALAPAPQTPVLWLGAVEDGRGLRFDEAGGMQQAVAHLRQRGRRRLGLVLGSYQLRHAYQELRRRAFLAATADLAGSAVLDVAIAGGADAPRIRDDIAAFLAAHPDLDGLILSNSDLAACTYAAAAGLGRRIPSDLAVIGVNAQSLGQQVFPALTTLEGNLVRMGRLAVELLARLPEPADAVLPFQLMPRAST